MYIFRRPLNSIVNLTTKSKNKIKPISKKKEWERPTASSLS